MAFDTRQYSLDNYYASELSYVYGDWEKNPQQTEDKWRQLQCDNTRNLIFDQAWRPIISSVCGTECRYLEVNLQNCFCPCYCGKLEVWVAEALAEEVYGKDNLKEIRFLGVSELAARMQIRDLFRNHSSPPASCVIELAFAGTLAGIHNGQDATWHTADTLVTEGKDREAIAKLGKDVQGLRTMPC